MRCNAHALISCTAQELAASAHIDLSSNEAIILDDSDGDDLLVLTNVDFTEDAVLVELEKPKLSILSLQIIMEKQATDPDLICLMADSCVLMEMKWREQCSFLNTHKFNSLTSQYWSKPAIAVAITPSETDNVDIICAGSIVKLINSEDPDGNAITMVILAVFTKYNGKFWMQGQQEEANLMRAALQSASTHQSKLTKVKDTRFLVQCVSICDDGNDVFVHVAFDENDVKDVFGLVETSEVGNMIGFHYQHQIVNNFNEEGKELG